MCLSKLLAIYEGASHSIEKERKMGAILEMIMLICFGLSWPMNVMKAYKAKTAKGSSLPFILLIITGYMAGISAKVITGQINFVLIVYVINLMIVLANLLVYFRNVSLDRECLA